MLIKDLIKHLQAYDPETTCAHALWLPEDVKGIESGKDLTDEQVNSVLDTVEHCHDANYGITWDTLECHCQNM